MKALMQSGDQWWTYEDQTPFSGRGYIVLLRDGVVVARSKRLWVS